jgi:hypothetical protein
VVLMEASHFLVKNLGLGGMPLREEIRYV